MTNFTFFFLLAFPSGEMTIDNRSIYSFFGDDGHAPNYPIGFSRGVGDQHLSRVGSIVDPVQCLGWDPVLSFMTGQF